MLPMIDGGVFLIMMILATYIFIGVMGSSGQKVTLESLVGIGSGDADTVITSSIDNPFEGYVTNVAFHMTSLIAWNAQMAIRAGYWHKPDADELFNNNASVLELNSTGISHVQGHYILFTRAYEAAAGNNFTCTYSKKTYLPIKKNDFPAVRVRMDDLGNSLTTGDIVLKTYVTILVGCNNHRGRRRAVPVFNYIFALTTDTDWNSAWLPHCNGIMRNIRLTCYNMNSGDTDQGETTVRFGPDVTVEDVGIGQEDAIEMRSDDRVIIVNIGSSVDGVSSNYTNFRTGHWRVDRTGQVGLEMAQGTESDNIMVSIDFDFFPDYGAQIDYAFHVENLSIAGGWDKFFPIPFDMYIRTIHIDWYITGTTAALNIVRVGLYEDSRPDIGSSSEVTVHGGSLAGSIDTLRAATNELPANVIGTFNMDLESVNDVIVNANSGDDDFDVFDFVNQGGLVAFACHNEVGTVTPDFDVIVKGESRHSGDINFGGSNFEGHDVYNLEITR